MAKQNAGPPAPGMQTQDQWFSSFSSAPAGTYDCEMALTETSVGRRFFGPLSAAPMYTVPARKDRDMQS